MPKKSAARKKRNKTNVVLNVQRPIKKRKSRRKRRSPARRITRMIAAQGYSQEVRELIASTLDPFEVSACIPDGAVGRGCFSVKQQSLLGTGTGTACSLIVSPDPDSFTVVDTGSANATPTITGSFAAASAVTNIDAMYGGYRIISGGIRCQYVGNTNADQGILVIGQVDRRLTSQNAFNGLSLSAACANFMWYRSYPLRLGAQITWRADDKESMDSWIFLLNGLGTVAQVCRGSYFAVLVYGASTATASLLNCEYIFNFEGTYRQQTFTGGGVSEAQTAPATVGWYENMRNAVKAVEPIVPLVGAALKEGLSGYLRDNYSGLGTMANGLPSPGLLGRGFHDSVQLGYY